MRIATGYVCLLALASITASAQTTTLTLRQAVDQIDKLNPDLALARLRVIESEAQAAVVQSGYLPQANLLVQGAYQTNNLQGIGLVFPGFPSRLGPYRTFNARPQITQTILDLSLLSQIRAARAQKGMAELEVRVAREDLTIAVVQLYLQALQADSRISASAARLRTAGAILRQVADKEQTGTASKLDLARATEQLENERGIQIAAERDARVLRTMLLKAIGLEQTAGAIALEKPAFTLPLEEEVAQSAATRRPELAVLQARAGMASLERKAAGQQRLPRLTGFGDYGVLGAGPDSSLSTYTIGATLTIPLWTGRRIESQIRAAAVREDQVKQQIRRTALQIQQEVRQASVELQSALDALRASTRAARASKDILELATLRYQSGLATSVDTQVAQSAFASAEDQRIRNEYEVLLAQAKLAKSGGAILELIR